MFSVLLCLFLLFSLFCLVPAHVWRITVPSARQLWTQAAVGHLVPPLTFFKSHKPPISCLFTACFHHVCALPVWFQFTACSASPVFYCCAQRCVFMSGFYSCLFVPFVFLTLIQIQCSSDAFPVSLICCWSSCVSVQQHELLPVTRWFWQQIWDFWTAMKLLSNLKWTFFKTISFLFHILLCFCGQ